MATVVKLICATCGVEFERDEHKTRGKEKSYCSNPCRHESRRGGKWTPHNKIENDELLSDLRNLVIEKNSIPNTKDIQNKWPGRQTLYARRFGSLVNALRQCGINLGDYEIRRSKKEKRDKVGKGRPTYTEEQLIIELRRVAEILGHTPTDSEFRKNGNCSAAPYWTKFGSWAKACELAGLKPHTTAEGGTHLVPRIHYIRRRDGERIMLQGTYEKRFAQLMDDYNISWFAHGEFPAFVYQTDDGESHKYHPDFYIPQSDLYIETKGWFREKDKIKTRLAWEQNPDKQLIVITREILRQAEKDIWSVIPKGGDAND